jgi:hypothetical protein
VVEHLPYMWKALDLISTSEKKKKKERKRKKKRKKYG